MLGIRPHTAIRPDISSEAKDAQQAVFVDWGAERKARQQPVVEAVEDASAGKSFFVDGVEDRGETVSQMEPMLLGAGLPQRPQLADLVLDLAQKSARLKASLPAGLLAGLAELVQTTSCYFSDLLEGIETHPVEIVRALGGEFSGEGRQRDLQLGAKAQIEVLRWVERGGVAGGKACTAEGVRSLHRQLFGKYPEALLWMEDPITRERQRMLPGEVRTVAAQAGSVEAVSPRAVPRFLERFEQVYGQLGKAESILAAAAAHHRLQWIHPFMNGDGRVARLMTHATLLETLDTGGAWSMERGLARNAAQYRALLAHCSAPRPAGQGSGDALSEPALAEFTRFFLGVCVAEVDFMIGLMEPERLRARVLGWAEEESRVGELPLQSGTILEAILRRGELPRGEAGSVVGAGERHARRMVSALAARGVLESASPRAPLRLTFPAELAHRWLPGLFPEGGG
jgi:Fic family protein